MDVDVAAKTGFAAWFLEIPEKSIIPYSEKIKRFALRRELKKRDCFLLSHKRRGFGRS
jgi:hypothetical protein